MSKGHGKPGKRPRRVIPVSELASAQMENFFKVVGEGDPLSCVLIGASYLENALGSILENFLIDDGGDGDTKVTHSLLNDPFGPLSTYSARCKTCYALGFLSRTDYENLKKIGDIRNRFAHSHEPIDFDHEDIKTISNGLKGRPLVHADGTPLTPEELDWQSYGFLIDASKMPAARYRFLLTVSGLWGLLSVTAYQAERRPRPTGITTKYFLFPPKSAKKGN